STRTGTATRATGTSSAAITVPAGSDTASLSDRGACLAGAPPRRGPSRNRPGTGVLFGHAAVAFPQRSGVLREVLRRLGRDRPGAPARATRPAACLRRRGRGAP